MQHAESDEADAQVNLSSVYPYSVTVVIVAPLLPRDDFFADCGYLNVLVHCQFEHSHLNFVSNAAGKGENSPVYVWHTRCTVSRSTRRYDPSRAFISCTNRTCCPTLSKRWILRWLRVSKCSCAHDNHVHVHNHALFVQLMKALLGSKCLVDLKTVYCVCYMLENSPPCHIGCDNVPLFFQQFWYTRRFLSSISYSNDLSKNLNVPKNIRAYTYMYCIQLC